MTYRYQKFVSSFDTLTSLLGFYCFAGIVPFFFRESGTAVMVLCALTVVCALLVTVQLVLRFRRAGKDQNIPLVQLLQLLERLGFIKFRFSLVVMLLLSGLHFAGWRYFHVIPAKIPLLSAAFCLVLASAWLFCYVYRKRVRLHIRMAPPGEMLDNGRLFPQSALAPIK